MPTVLVSLGSVLGSRVAGQTVGVCSTLLETSFFFLMSLKKLFIYFWLCWVFVAVRGLSLVEASRRYSSLQCMGFSLQWLLLLRSTGSNCTVFSHCGASQGSNLCPLHWQVDSYPLYHQGSPCVFVFNASSCYSA